MEEESLADPEEASDEALGAASEIIDAIVSVGGKILTESVLRRNIIKNAWLATREVTCSRVQMCFVPHDESALEDGWYPEEEIPPPDKDGWGRKQIEVVRAKPQAAGDVSPTRRRRSSVMHVHRAPSRAQARRASWLAIRSRMSPLSTAEEVEDPDDALRQLWIQRLAKRAAFAEQVAMSEAKVKSQEAQRRLREMQAFQKEHAEGTGSIAPSSIRAPAELERLPKMNDSMHFDIRSVKESSSSATTLAESLDGLSPEARSRTVKLAEDCYPVEPQGFTHGFEKLGTCQPSLLQTMDVVPGVVLECQGRRKFGPRVRPDRPAWKDYQNGEAPILSNAGEPGEGELAVEMEESTSEVATMQAPRLLPRGDSSRDTTTSRPSSANPSRAKADFGEGMRRPASAHAGLGVSKSAAAVVTTAVCWLGQGTRSGMPVKSEVEGLKAPASPQQLAKRVADAPRPRASRSASCSVLAQGVLRSQPRNPRQKVVLIGGRGLPPPPPLGATMGHGLLPNEPNLRAAVRKGEFFYPAPCSGKADKQWAASPSVRSVAEKQRSMPRAWR
mmetsp:Transcript_15985/g.37875  ORF Transcript_15985/g.37875 Transcript_15985/m.37875 type:complete len:558 (+) Transcript_15985:62-1735(+)